MEKPGEDDRRRAGGLLGDSWGGWIVVLCSLAVVADAAGSLFLDGRSLIETVDYRTVEVRYGSRSLLLMAGLWAVMAGLSALAVLERLERLKVWVAFATPVFAALAWGALASQLRGDAGAWPMEMMLLTFLCVGMMASPPTRATLTRLNTLRDVVALTTVAYSAIDASTQLPCRDDKCGVFGSIWPGYFTHENSAGAYVALLAPAMILASGRRFVFSNAVMVLFLAASASRTALLAYLVSLLFMLAYRSRVRDSRDDVPALLWRVFPLAALTGSTLVFLLPFGDDFLTGRGMIYQAIRDTFNTLTRDLIGVGPQYLADGVMGGWIHTAHGQAPHLMIMFGIPGLVLVAIALSSLVPAAGWTWQRTVAIGFLVALSTRFVTEAGMLTELRSQESTVLLLCVGLFAAQPGGISAMWTRRHEADENRMAAVTGQRRAVHDEMTPARAHVPRHRSPGRAWPVPTGRGAAVSPH